MALSKTITANGSKGHHRFTLEVIETRTENLTSYLEFTLKISPIQNGWDWSGWGSQITYNVNIGNNNYSGAIPSYDGYSTVTLRSANNISIPHNSDGTKTISINFSVSDGTGAYYTCGDASASADFKLSDLHKKPIVAIDFENSKELNDRLPTYGSISNPNFKFYNELSMLQFRITATTFDNTSIVQYNLTDGLHIISVNDGIFDIAIMPNYLDNFVDGNLTLKFNVEDSMGATSEYVEFTAPVVMYYLPYLVQTSSTVKREGQITGKAKLNLLGYMYKNVNEGLNNNVNLQFAYWEFGTPQPSNLQFIDIPSNVINIIEPSDGSNNYKIEVSNWVMSNAGQEITNFDKEKAYNVIVKISDILYIYGTDRTLINLICPKGEWLMAKFKDRVDFKKITIQNKEISTPSICSMKTTNNVMYLYGETIIEGWEELISYGDFSCDVSNNGMIIRNTSILELSGQISGHYNCNAKWTIYELNGDNLTLYNFKTYDGVLYQFAGNNYFSAPLNNAIIDLDKEKEYIVKLRVGNYNGSVFELNNGFGGNGTFIIAKKIL